MISTVRCNRRVLQNPLRESFRLSAALARSAMRRIRMSLRIFSFGGLKEPARLRQNSSPIFPVSYGPRPG